MSIYSPIKWVVIKIIDAEDSVSYRVFGSWSGGYLDGASWRLNSGVTQVTEQEDIFIFTGESGSEYHCAKRMYGTNAYTHGILNEIIVKSPEYTVEILDHDTDWLNLV